MQYRVSFTHEGESERGEVVVDAESWLEALARGSLVLNGSARCRQLAVTIDEDEAKAEIQDVCGQWQVSVHELRPESEARSLAPTSSSAPTYLHQPIPLLLRKPRPIVPEPGREDGFAQSTKYVTGTTEPYITDAFMELADLYGAHGLDHQAAIERSLQFLLRTFDVAGGMILEQDIDDPRKVLEVRAAVGSAGVRAGQDLPLDHGIAGAALRGGAPMGDERMECFTVEPLSADPLCEHEVPSGPILAVPMTGENYQEGVIVLYRNAATEPFDESQQEIIQYVASALGQYLSLVHTELRRDPSPTARRGRLTASGGDGDVHGPPSPGALIDD